MRKFKLLIIYLETKWFLAIFNYILYCDGPILVTKGLFK